MIISLWYWKSLSHQYASRHATREVESVGGKQLPHFWVIRLVDNYITLNLHAIIPFGGCFACACMLVYSYTEYVVLAENRHMGPINAFRSFMWCVVAFWLGQRSALTSPLRRLSVCLEGYSVCCASLQAYVVVARKTQRMSRTGGWNYIPPPRAFNIGFIALTVGMAGSMIGSDIGLAVVWTRAWEAISGLRNALVKYEAAWTGGVDVMALLDLNAKKADVAAKVAQTVPLQHAVVGSLIVCAMVIAFVSRRRR